MNEDDVINNDISLKDRNGTEKHPERYVACNGLECWDVLRSLLDKKNLGSFDGWLYGNMFRYLWRLGDKDEPERELMKIRNYIDKWLEVAHEQEGE